jgi:hypothetical protein
LSDWFNRNLSDPGLQALARTEYTRDNAITRNDMLALFSQAEADGTVTGAEFSDLANVVDFVPNMPGYVRYLSNKVVAGDAANAYYQGQALGNLYPGSSGTQLASLVNKWFLGLDHPTVVLTANQISAGWTATKAAYAAVSGSLFGQNGPSYTDIFQGSLGDCTVLASLAETAARTNLVSSMFIDNGDNTWTVRFFNNGVAGAMGTPAYVTVDNQLPGGGGLYDHVPTGILWAALAEKAYAQLNESGWLATLTPGRNSYQSLDNGNQNTMITALSAFTGLSANAFSFDANNVAQALQQGKLVVLGTGNTVANPYIEHNHAYAVVAYNSSSSQPFAMFNPWGINGGNDNGQFKSGTFSADSALLNANFVYWAATGYAPESPVGRRITTISSVGGARPSVPLAAEPDGRGHLLPQRPRSAPELLQQTMRLLGDDRWESALWTVDEWQYEPDMERCR